jgi:enoyl-CoA hydratase/carnithine racemase
MPEINIGAAANIETAILCKTMSIFLVREICLGGVNFDAARAEKYGLVNEVVPFEQLDARALQWAEKLAGKEASALAVQKDIINKWLATDLETAMDYSIPVMKLCEHQDFKL